MSWLARDGTAKPVSRNQILRHERGRKEIFPCSTDHEQNWQPYAVDMYSAVCDDQTCIRIYSSVYPQLPPVIGAPWGCCGHASGIYFPRPLWFGGCATHATRCFVPGYSYFRMCLEKSERNCLTSYLYNAAILASFFLFICLKGCFRLSLSTRNKIKRTVTSKKHASRPANLLLCLLQP